MKRIGGFRRKTRHLLKKNYKLRGKISIRNFLQNFKIGDFVYLFAEPAYHKGMYNPRFHNKKAMVKKKIGDCYEVEIRDGSIKKMLVVHPVHLRRC